MNIYVALREDERKALGRLAERERRSIKDQAAILIIDALRRRGLLEGRHLPDGVVLPDYSLIPEDL